MTSKQVIGVAIVVGVILLAAGAAFLLYPMTDQKTVKSESASTNTKQTASETPLNSSLTIVFTDSGFEQSKYTVKKGQTITVKNQSSNELEFASDDHPTHRQQPELNTATTAPGESTNFTPTKTGTWGFHDHIRSQFTGELIVTD